MRFIARFFLFVVVLSIAELYLLVEMASRFSLGLTLLLCILTGVVGGAMVRRQGLATLAEIGQSLNAGQIPGAQIVSGLILLITGTLLLTPGFITDTVAFLLLIPPLRRMAAVLLLAYFKKSILIKSAGFAGSKGAGPQNRPPWNGEGPRPRNEDVIIEVDAVEPDK